MQRQTADDKCVGTFGSANGDFRILIHTAVLAAAEHATDHLGVALDAHRSLFHVGSPVETRLCLTTASAVNATLVTTKVLESGIDILIAGQRS